MLDVHHLHKAKDGAYAQSQETLRDARQQLSRPWPYTRYSAFLDDIAAKGRLKVNVYEEWGVDVLSALLLREIMVNR